MHTRDRREPALPIFVEDLLRLLEQSSSRNDKCLAFNALARFNGQKKGYVVPRLAVLSSLERERGAVCVLLLFGWITDIAARLLPGGDAGLIDAEHLAMQAPAGGPVGNVGLAGIRDPDRFFGG